MTQSINATITSALTEAGVPEYSHSSYQTQIDAVEKALTEREYQITDGLLALAAEFGNYSEDEVKDMVARRTGLTFRPVVVPEPEVEVEIEGEEEVTEEQVSGTSKGKKGKRLDAMEKKVDDLTASVAQLVQLAQRHLGASL